MARALLRIAVTVALLTAALPAMTSARGTMPGAKPRPRSPLERSPGYYPPDDPESLSVLTGRRKAKAVSMPLSGGARSIEDLAKMLVAGVGAKNESALHALRLTRREFEVICWPEFPESRPITRITADDAWELSDPTSKAGAGRAISQYGGHPLKLTRIEIARHEPYRNFTLHRGVVLHVQDETTKQAIALKFAPSFVERKGRYKVLMFKD